MASTIEHVGDLSFKFTNGEGLTIDSIELYEYEVGGLWQIIDTNQLATLADTESVTYTVSQDNVYKIAIFYSTGGTDIRKEFIYLVTDTIENIIYNTLVKVFCGCNVLTKCKQKDYYKFNRLLIFVAAAFGYVYKNRNNATSTMFNTVKSTITSINTRINDFYSNCEFKPCSTSNCTCL